MLPHPHQTPSQIPFTTNQPLELEKTTTKVVLLITKRETLLQISILKSWKEMLPELKEKEPEESYNQPKTIKFS